MVKINKEMNDTSQIDVRNLRVQYDENVILKDICFSVPKGEFLTIVGKSGCGKSTLLYALADFIALEGEVSVPSKFGFVFQNYAVFPWLSVEKNIELGLSARDNFNSENLAPDLIDLIGLTGKEGHYPSQLSGGQNQRVALARALASDPDVIFMDEPFGSLDIYTRERMQKWLLDIWEKDHKTVIFVTHSIEEAIFLSDRVLVLSDKGIHAEFSVDYPRPRNSDIKFEASFLELKKQVLEQLEKH